MIITTTRIVITIIVITIIVTITIITAITISTDIGPGELHQGAPQDEEGGEARAGSAARPQQVDGAGPHPLHHQALVEHDAEREQLGDRHQEQLRDRQQEQLGDRQSHPLHHQAIVEHDAEREQLGTDKGNSWGTDTRNSCGGGGGQTITPSAPPGPR